MRESNNIDGTKSYLEFITNTLYNVRCYFNWLIKCTLNGKKCMHALHNSYRLTHSTQALIAWFTSQLSFTRSSQREVTGRFWLLNFIKRTGPNIYYAFFFPLFKSEFSSVIISGLDGTLHKHIAQVVCYSLLTNSPTTRSILLIPTTEITSEIINYKKTPQKQLFFFPLLNTNFVTYLSIFKTRVVPSFKFKFNCKSIILWHFNCHLIIWHTFVKKKK